MNSTLDPEFEFKFYPSVVSDEALGSHRAIRLHPDVHLKSIKKKFFFILAK
jgi:hypothetical protein